MPCDDALSAVRRGFQGRREVQGHVGSPAATSARSSEHKSKCPPEAPTSIPTHPLTDVSLRKHRVLSCTHEDRVSSADDYQQTMPARPERPRDSRNRSFSSSLPDLTTRASSPPLAEQRRQPPEARTRRIQHWPSHREACGIVSLRAHLTSTDSIDALVSVHHNELTIHIQSSRGGAFDEKMASIPVDRLIVTLHPRQFEILGLSCTTEDAGEIFCSCKDQTARNKWVYVLRRVAGVDVRPLQSLWSAGPRKPQRVPTL